jgi:RNA polymerase sigma-70 factor (ECF subfamily)
MLGSWPIGFSQSQLQLGQIRRFPETLLSMKPQFPWRTKSSRIIEEPVKNSVGRGPDDVSRPLTGAPSNRCRLEEYYGYVSYLVRQKCPPHVARQVEHEDLVQDVLLKAWASDADFSGRSDTERLSFLRKTCSSVLIDTIRRYDRGKRKVTMDQTLDDSSARLEEWLVAIQSSPSQRASNHEQLLRLAQSLAELPENQRKAMELHHLKRRSLAETAELMAISPQAAAGLLRRGLETLRDRLVESEGDGQGR